MTSARLPDGGQIDRTSRLRFTFDGIAFEGVEGDTLASALLANGVRLVGRSFKLHRPRGLWGAWFDEPNAIMDVRKGALVRTNMNAATTSLEDGMTLRAVNATPSARRDVKAVLDLLHPFLPAGFYYKTFTWPDWHLFEPWIRRMAGLGAVTGTVPEDFVSDQRFAQCDLLVVGGGPAGLSAAVEAAEAGRSVWLVEDHATLGGTGWQAAHIDGAPASEWISSMLARLHAAGAHVLTRCTAFGVYDHQMIALLEDRGFAQAPRLTRLRVGHCVLATGALDRPVTFAMNDRPGVMSLTGALDYAARYGVKVGSRAVALADHALAGLQIDRLAALGLPVKRIDPGDALPEAIGRRGVHTLRVGSAQHMCDTVLTSAGLMPVLHLWRHAGGKLEWSDEAAAFLPGTGPDWVTPVGAAAGRFLLEDACADGAAAARGKTRPSPLQGYSASPPPPRTDTRKRQWIDLQNDVLVKDVALAAREGFASVEHLKRYTTLGMATDQGKTSNVAGLSAMAALKDLPVAAVGTTTFRPPFTPVPFETYHGTRRGQALAPVKRVPLERQHRAAGAVLGEYGGWLRPGWYGADAPEQRVQKEALRARATGALFDGSPLGKIEVLGPDAAKLVNFVFYNRMDNLAVGRLRYGLILTEAGVVYDDGVVARLDENRFVVSCSSSHVDGVAAQFEAWRQDGHDPDRVQVHDLTHAQTVLTLTGPNARAVLETADLAVDLSQDAFGPMHWREGRFDGAPCRIARVSFTGDLSYEITVPNRKGPTVWEALRSAGEALDVAPMGVEALMILRAEKGFPVIGKDTDGETYPKALGLDGPRLRKPRPYQGDRGLETAKAQAPGRRLVGLRHAGNTPLPTGAHIVTDGQSRGYVTSSYASPFLGHPIALGLIDADLCEVGRSLMLYHLGETLQAQIAPLCAFDPEGARLNAG